MTYSVTRADGSVVIVSSFGANPLHQIRYTGFLLFAVLPFFKSKTLGLCPSGADRAGVLGVCD